MRTRQARRCSAQSKRTGERCKRFAPPGGFVCNLHGGKSPQAIAKAQKRVALERAGKAVAKLGAPVHVDPDTALSDLLAEVNALAAFFREQVDSLAAEGVGRMLNPIDGKAHAFLGLYGEYLDRTMRVAKVINESGINERRVRLAEAEANLIAQFVRGFCADVGLNIGDRHVIDAYTKNLRLVAGEPPEGVVDAEVVA